MSAPDLTVPIRNALLADAAVVGSLPSYLGSSPIFTRRPVPADSPYPCIVISQDITVVDQDGIKDYRPSLQRDIAVYHTNEEPSNYRIAASIAYSVWRLFNGSDYSILVVSDWAVVSFTAAPPVVVETAGSKVVGRVVQVEVSMAQLGLM